jgi:hypothetical protein
MSVSLLYMLDVDIRCRVRRRACGVVSPSNVAKPRLQPMFELLVVYLPNPALKVDTATNYTGGCLQETSTVTVGISHERPVRGIYLVGRDE